MKAKLNENIITTNEIEEEIRRIDQIRIYFGGLSVEEFAEKVGKSVNTVNYWRGVAKNGQKNTRNKRLAEKNINQINDAFKDLGLDPDYLRLKSAFISDYERYQAENKEWKHNRDEYRIDGDNVISFLERALECTIEEAEIVEDKDPSFSNYVYIFKKDGAETIRLTQHEMARLGDQLILQARFFFEWILQDKKIFTSYTKDGWKREEPDTWRNYDRNRLHI